MQPDTQRVGRDREARVHAGGSRERAAVYYVEVIETPISTMPIQRTRSRIGAHAHCSERVSEGLDVVHQRTMSSSLAKNVLGKDDQDFRCSIIAETIAVTYLQSRKPQAVSHRPIHGEAVLASWLVFGDRN